ncbi:cobyric acid synthase [uncultured Paenibacillus sp.]|uniref:cobyric acid synthase n=1 Tax=uncultured Paenibacillus sp. TaxID=227322 RepID=UPI0028D7A159|nr:cobyric acid synthase [uncultured Paenibacillus sp.]
MLEQYGHGGDLLTAQRLFGSNAGEFLDFSSNMNPLGPPQAVFSAIAAFGAGIARYPDPASRRLTARLAELHEIEEPNVLIGNGAAELIDLAVRALRPETAAVPAPSFSEYGDAVRKSGGTAVPVPLRADNGFAVDEAAVRHAMETHGKPSLWFFGSPNNPTGRLTDPKLVRRLADEGHTVVLDEAFIDFLPDAERLTLIRSACKTPGLIVLRSMTKLYAVPGIRVGYAAGHPETIAYMRDLQVPWSVNALAQAIGEAVLDDRPFVERTVAWLQGERPYLAERLSRLGLRVIPGAANFILFELPPESGMSAADLQREMGRRGVLIRDASRFDGLGAGYCRVAVKLRADNDRLVETLKACLGTNPQPEEPANRAAPNTAKPAYKAAPNTARPARTLMIQGTASDVGKSILTTALCRIFAQDGLRVAPFKSQNMSLNSYVTWDGKEIGVAQGMQADACGIPAVTDMNPILLKPTGHMASQVVVHGVPLRDYDARAYREQYLAEAEPIVKEALARLRSAYDVVVLEGAGSPAEVNLKDRDIVNMRMAGWAEAPVLLVADIDRGGVFASIVGTMDILEPHERDRVAGFIVNKFRGDASLLAPGIEWLEKRTGKPVLGVIPHLDALGLEDEDSLSLDARRRGTGPVPPGQRGGTEAEDAADGQKLDIAVIRLPRISNFTDFDPLHFEPDASVRYVTDAESLGEPDAVVIPGSKNAAEDMRFLRGSGLADAVDRYARGGGAVAGLCGGYEMMGRMLLDPDGVESGHTETAGFGWFPFRVCFGRSKRTVRVSGTAAVPGWAGDGLPVIGYEIHMGRIIYDEPCMQPFALKETSTGTEACAEAYREGVSSPDGRLWGTFMHGVLHNDDFRRSWLNALRRAKGRPPLPASLRFRERREAAFDRLAEHVRRHLDLPRIRAIAGLEEKA